MMKVQCPHCKKFLLNVWGEEAKDIMVDSEKGAVKSGQQVYLIFCPDCSKYLGVVNKQ